MGRGATLGLWCRPGAGFGVWGVQLLRLLPRLCMGKLVLCKCSLSFFLSLAMRGVSGGECDRVDGENGERIWPMRFRAPVAGFNSTKPGCLPDEPSPPCHTRHWASKAV